MKQVKVSSSQFNYQYGDQIHFPYSIASLVTYLKSNLELSKNFQFEKTFVFREKLDEYIQKCQDTDILLCSCYVWNWEITNHLAQEVKKLNPNCLIIFGGPQVPDFSDNFFENYPYVDIIVHGEGEHIIENIFNQYITDKNYLQIKGIETKDFRTEPQPRINDLDSLPSPYLTNTVWDLVDKIDGIRWISSWETNRGCPYQCTFCDWGSATATKMRKWSESRLYKEIEWFADNKIPYIDCCDANFGIYQDRDFHLAEKLKESALKTGFPERIRPAWAKNSSEKIIPIAKELQDGGILGAVTLAVQSLDSETLNIMKRANIKFNKFSDLTNEFRNGGIPTYTELIMGLPGETLESWKDGLENIAKTKVDTVFIYNCSVLPNAPMNVPQYREKYKIKTIRSPIMLVHSSIHNRGIPEFEDIMIGADSYSFDELKEIWLYSWMFIVLQSLGLLELITNYYNKTENLNFMKFFESVLKFCRTKKSIFSEEYEKVVKFRDGGYSGKGWDHHDSKLGDIIWPIEEASWLRLSFEEKRLLDDIFSLLKYIEEEHGFTTDENILKDLAKFQVFLLTTRGQSKEIKSENFEYDWKNYFVNGIELSKQKKLYIYKNKVIEENPHKWSYKTIWYGRRSRDFKCNPEELQEDESEIKVSQIVQNSN
tara:strand:- start:114 stop:2075 length:1962 start_codon:yes stop_codon:yes gene_type:complete